MQVRKSTVPENTKFDARSTLQALAKPRLTGSEGAAETETYIKERLQSLGYEIREHPFTFSTWPGRFAVSVAGALYTMGALTAAAMLHASHPGVALVILLVMLMVIGALAALTPQLISMLPWGRVQGNNLIAHRPGSRPRYFLMAHRDSKSQPVPLAFRGPAIALAVLAWVALTAAAALALLDPIFNRQDVALVLGAIGVVSGVILIFCWVDNRSPGALDNASGVATMLGVAESEAAAGDVAIVVTDAEELGLAGARALAPSLPPSFGVINIDGIDDHGAYYIIERFGWPRKTGAAPHLAAALLHAAHQLNVPATRRDVPIGLLVDHIPVVRAGTPAITLMRGSLRSLRRVHRPGDSLEHITGSGITQAVTFLSKAIQYMRESGTP